MARKCEICESDYNVKRNPFTQQLLCNKHYQQTSKYYKSIDPNTTPCEICGSRYDVSKRIQLNQYLCSAHYTQFKKHGKFFNRTVFDKNKIIIDKDNNYAKIELYNKECEIVNYALIDIEDIDKIKEYKWCLDKRGYIITYISGNYSKLHRFILDIKESQLIVDHKSGDTLDNRKGNLRVCTQSQNGMNKCIQSNNTSGVVGVYFHKQREKWNAYINLSGKRKSLGLFINFEDAVKARKKAEEKYFGEFSYDNSRKSSEQTG